MTKNKKTTAEPIGAEAINQLQQAVLEVNEELGINSEKSAKKLSPNNFAQLKINFLKTKKEMRKAERLFEEDFITENELRKVIDSWLESRKAFKQVEIELEDR